MRHFVVTLVLLVCLTSARGQNKAPLFKPSHGTCANYFGGLSLGVTASPDLGGIAPAALVTPGTTVRLFGISERVTVTSTCKITSQQQVPFQWNLTYRTPGGQDSNVLSLLENKNTLTPTFLANNTGIFFATLTADRQSFTLRIEVIHSGHGWIALGPMGLVPNGSDATPNVGRVNDLAFDPRNQSVIYASTAWGGVFRSTDAGDNWTPLMDHKGLPHLGTGAITVSATGTIFVGIGDIHPTTFGDVDPSGTAGQIWRSDDSGVTWHVSQGQGCIAPAVDVVDGKVNRIFVGSRIPNQVMIATEDGMFRSIDGGDCWQRVPGLSTGEFTDLNFDPRSDDTLWVALQGTPPSAGVALVTGAWSATPTVGSFYAPSKDQIEWTVIARAPSNPATTYFAFATISKNKSRADIVRAGTNANGTSYIKSVNTSQCTSQCQNHIAIAVHPLNEEHVLFGEVEPHHSQNGGKDFGGLANNETAHDDFHVIVFPPNTFDEVFAGSDGGVFRLPFDGQQYQHAANEWIAQDQYLNINQAATVANSSTHRETVALGSWDNGSQQRVADRTWSVIRAGDGAVVSYDAAPADKLYLNNNAGNGSDTLREPGGKDFGQPAGFEANPYVVGEFWGQRLVGKKDTGAYVWTDQSNGWLCADPAPSATRNVTNVDFSADGHYYTGADDGSIHRFTLVGMTKKVSCGFTTPLVSPELVYQEPPGGNTRVSVSVDPFDPASVYAVLTTPASLPNRIIHATKNGSGWSVSSLAASLPAGLELNAAIAADPSLKGVVYIATQKGVWAGTPDSGGYDWAIEMDVPDTSVTFLQAERAGGAYSGVLRLSTYGRGIWERIVSTPCPPTGCPTQSNSIQPIHCLACSRMRESKLAATESVSELTLQVPIPQRMRQSKMDDHFVRVTPSLGGKALPFFLCSAGARTKTDQESTIVTLAYRPDSTGPAVMRTDGLIVEEVDREGRLIGPREVQPYTQSWRRPGIVILRVTAFEQVGIKQPIAAKVKITSRTSRSESGVTPTEAAVSLDGGIKIRWADDAGTWQGSKPVCFLNGAPYAYSANMRLKIESDAILSCGTSRPEEEAEGEARKGGKLGVNW